MNAARARTGAGGAPASARRSGAKREAASTRRSSPRPTTRDPRAPAARRLLRAPSRRAARPRRARRAAPRAARRAPATRAPARAGTCPSADASSRKYSATRSCAGADPDDLAGRGQRIQMLGPEPTHTPRQDLGLPQRNRQRQRLQRNERFAKRSAPADAVPRRSEARERLLLDGLHLASKRGERGTPEAAKHVGIAPLALGAAGPKLTAHEQLLALELDEDAADVAAEPRARVVRRERPASLREAKHELAQRIGAALEERVRQARRRHRTERVAIAARVLGRDQPLFACDAHQHGAALGEQRRGELAVVLAGAKVAADPQLVVQLVGARRRCRAAAARRPRPRRGRAGRAAPPGRAARAAGRDRATAPARAVRRAACRPRTYRSRCSRRAATPSTVTRSASRPRRDRARASAAPAGSRAAHRRSNTSCRHSR